MSLRQCRNTPLEGDARTATEREQRQFVALWLLGKPLPLSPAFESLGVGQRTARQTTAAIAGVGAYAVASVYEALFLMRLDPLIVRALAAVIVDERRRIETRRVAERPREPDAPGYLYVFWNPTAGDNRLLKIGRTRRADPHARLVEWERALDGSLTLLYAQPTRYNQLGERLVHTALECEHEAHLRATASARKMDEMFLIERPLVLWVFLALALRQVDAVGDALNEY